MTTAAQELQAAYNEFIAEFCDNHGHNQATRDEAHEVADRAREIGKVLGRLAQTRALMDDLDDMIAAIDWGDADETIIAGWAAKVASES